MSLLSIDEIIELGDVSTYLSLKYKDEGKLFGARLDGISPKSIAIVTDALRWWNESFPNIDPQRATCNLTITNESLPDGNTIYLKIIDPLFGLIIISSYVTTGEEDPDQIASALSASLNSGSYGYTSIANSNTLTIHSPLDSAASYNGISPFAIISPDSGYSIYYEFTNFSGGINKYDNGSRGVANYLYWMCGKFQIEAQFIIQGVGGGIVSVLDPFATPSPIEFTVTESSVIEDGESSVTLTQFIGYNILFMRNNVPQSTINNGGSYFTWNKSTGSFSISQPAYSGELFQIYPFI